MIEIHIENDNGIEWMVLDTTLENNFHSRHGGPPEKNLVCKCSKEFHEIAICLMIDKENDYSVMHFGWQVDVLDLLFIYALKS